MTTSRLSYASSPESDLELSPGPSASLSLGNLPQLVKSNSDPSIATNQDNLDHDREEMVEGMPPPYTVRISRNRLEQPNFHVIIAFDFSP
jgi:tight junction protein 1